MDSKDPLMLIKMVDGVVHDDRPHSDKEYVTFAYSPLNFIVEFEGFDSWEELEVVLKDALPNQEIYFKRIL